MTSAALSVDRARAIGAAGATLCAGATLLGRHSLLRPALIAAASILGTQRDDGRQLLLPRPRLVHGDARAAALAEPCDADRVALGLELLPHRSRRRRHFRDADHRQPPHDCTEAGAGPPPWRADWRRVIGARAARHPPVRRPRRRRQPEPAQKRRVAAAAASSRAVGGGGREDRRRRRRRCGRRKGL